MKQRLFRVSKRPLAYLLAFTLVFGLLSTAVIADENELTVGGIELTVVQPGGSDKSDDIIADSNDDITEGVEPVVFPTDSMPSYQETRTVPVEGIWINKGDGFNQLKGLNKITGSGVYNIAPGVVIKVVNGTNGLWEVIADETAEPGSFNLYVSYGKQKDSGYGGNAYDLFTVTITGAGSWTIGEGGGGTPTDVEAVLFAPYLIDQKGTLTIYKTVVRDGISEDDEYVFNFEVYSGTEIVEGDTPVATPTVKTVGGSGSETVFDLEYGAYTVREVNSDEYTVYFVGGATVTVSSENADVELNVTNTYIEQKGTLTINKTVVRDDMQKDAVYSFDFEVYSGDVIAEGDTPVAAATVRTVGGSGSETINDLEYGVYTVREVNSDEYTVYFVGGATVTVGSENADVELSIINTYDAGEDQVAKGTFTITKTVRFADADGVEMEADANFADTEYAFEVTNAVTGYPVSNFSLKDGERLELELPVGTYLIQEAYIYDGDVYEWNAPESVTVEIALSEDSGEVVITANDELVEGDVVFEFVNLFNLPEVEEVGVVKGTFAITKTVRFVGADNVEMEADASFANTEYAFTARNTLTGELVGAFSLKDGERHEFELPVGTYLIREAYVYGGDVYEWDTPENVTVDIAYFEETDEVVVTVNGESVEGDVEIEFVNTFKHPEKVVVKGAFAITKNVRFVGANENEIPFDTSFAGIEYLFNVIDTKTGEIVEELVPLMNGERQEFELPIGTYLIQEVYNYNGDVYEFTKPASILVVIALSEETGEVAVTVDGEAVEGDIEFVNLFKRLVDPTARVTISKSVLFADVNGITAAANAGIASAMFTFDVINVETEEVVRTFGLRHGEEQTWQLPAGTYRISEVYTHTNADYRWNRPADVMIVIAPSEETGNLEVTVNGTLNGSEATVPFINLFTEISVPGPGPNPRVPDDEVIEVLAYDDEDTDSNNDTTESDETEEVVTIEEEDTPLGTLSIEEEDTPLGSSNIEEEELLEEEPIPLSNGLPKLGVNDTLNFWILGLFASFAAALLLIWRGRRQKGF